MRIIGLDIHRAYAEAVAWDDGKLKRLGRVDMRRPLLEAFAKKLSKEDVVVVEATATQPQSLRWCAQTGSPASSAALMSGTAELVLPGVVKWVPLSVRTVWTL